MPASERGAPVLNTLPQEGRALQATSLGGRLPTLHSYHYPCFADAQPHLSLYSDLGTPKAEGKPGRSQAATCVTVKGVSASSRPQSVTASKLLCSCSYFSNHDNPQPFLKLGLPGPCSSALENSCSVPAPRL